VAVGADDEEQFRLAFQDCVIDGDDMYFSALNINALFKMNLKTHEVELLGWPPVMMGYTTNTFLGISKIDDRLFLTPWQASAIVSYDLSDKSFVVHEFKDAGIWKSRLMNVIEREDELFFIPSNYASIIGLNKQNQKFHYYKDWRKGLPGNDVLYFASGAGVLRDNNILIPCHNPEGIIEFNCTTGRSRLHNQFPGCRSIVADGDYYWVTGKTPIIWKWNYDTGEIIAMTDFPQELDLGADGGFHFAVKAGDYLVVFPINGNKTLKINTHTGQITSWDIPGDDWAITGSWGWWHRYSKPQVVKGRWIYVYSLPLQTLLKIDVTTDATEEIAIQYPRDQVYSRLLQNYAGAGVLPLQVFYVIENLERGLTQFLRCIPERSTETKAAQSRSFQSLTKDGSAFSGKQIFNYVNTLANS
jgi:hypothetical protein